MLRQLISDFFRRMGFHRRDRGGRREALPHAGQRDARQKRQIALIELVADLFDAQELRQLVFKHADGDEILRGIPEGGSLNDLTTAVVTAFFRRGTEGELLALMARVRPGRSADIAAVAALWPSRSVSR